MADDLLPIPLRRGQWAVLLGAAANYDVRVPREQGDGGECLEVIAAALGVDVPPLRESRPASREEEQR